MFRDGSGRGRGEGRGVGGRGGGPATGSSRGGGSYTQTQTPPRGARGGPGGRGSGGGRGQPQYGGRGGDGGGKYTDDHPMTGRVLTTNWNGRLPPTGRGAVIEIFGTGNPAPPSALIRQMEDGRKLGGELDSMFKSMSLDGKNPLPVRPGYNTEGQEIKLYANYFPVHVKPIKINKYNVAFVGAQPPQAKKGQLIRILVEGDDLKLAKNQIPYRTNFRDIICTTKDIIGVEGLKKEGDTSKHIAIKYVPEWEDPPVAGEASERVRQMYKVQITFDFTFDLADLMKRLDPREARPLPERVESIIQALNAMFNHNPYTNENAVAVVAKTGLNKYFDKGRADDDKATFKDLSDGLEAIRGFIKSVRLGTGRILLNVNVATGVFVQPVSLRYFYKETLRQYPIQAKEKRLKLLRVGRIHLKKTKGGRTIYPPATILGFAKQNDGHENKKADPKSPKKGPEEKRQPPRFVSAKWPNPPGPKQVEFCLQPRNDATKTPEKWISVFDYFKQNYPQFQLDPELPVVNIGSTAFPSYIPLEAAIILAGNQSKGKLDGNQTATMVNFACRKPKQNAMAITEGGREILGLDAPQNDGILKLGITVDKNMITVSARVLNAPDVKYLNKSLRVNDGSWNLIGVKFAVPKGMLRWTYVCIDDLDPNRKPAQKTWWMAQNAAAYVDLFIDSMKNLQMPIGPKVEAGPILCPKDKINQMIKKVKAACVDWLLVILPDSDTGIYNAIKKAGDIDYGVKTVCVTAEKFMKGNPTPRECNGQYFGNVALKFNLKAGGTNNTLAESGGAAPLRFISNDKTMIIGLDVTHPSPGSSSSAPSVAAMVASVDGTLGQWLGVISVQKAGAPGSAREMVDELKTMLESRLKLWAAGHEGQLPENIILYRDGISEGQYDLCLEQELPRLKDATKSKEFQHQYGKNLPRWSIIVCSKRHHTRFFPAMEGIKNASRTSNCVAGTTVDRDVTTPQYWEFFLQAHHCIQGTAKPCRYIVIKDEIFGNEGVINSGPKAAPMTAAAMLPYITNNMCHMFGRATKAVSLCPPAYYADILCERARVYLSREFIGDRDLPHDDQDVVVDKKPMRWIRDFKPEQWDALPQAKKNHYHSKAQRHRDNLQTQCNLHPDVANTMFYV